MAIRKFIVRLDTAASDSFYPIKLPGVGKAYFTQAKIALMRAWPEFATFTNSLVPPNMRIILQEDTDTILDPDIQGFICQVILSPKTLTIDPGFSDYNGVMESPVEFTSILSRAPIVDNDLVIGTRIQGTFQSGVIYVEFWYEIQVLTEQERALIAWGAQL